MSLPRIYPESMTDEEIMEFEYEYERYLDLKDTLSLVSINQECQIIAQQNRSEDWDYFDDSLEDPEFSDQERWPLWLL